jgi:hypothetical protein
MLAALAQGFGLGILQPLLTPAHVLAFIGLGLLIGRQRGARALLLALFALSLAAGLGALATAVGVTPARNVLLASAALSGIGVAAAITVPRFAVGLLAAASGVALGLDSPPETVSIAMGNAMLAGTWVGGCLFLAIVVGSTARLTTAWQQIALRVLGSWIAASAILSLALRLFR